MSEAAMCCFLREGCVAFNCYRAFGEPRHFVMGDCWRHLRTICAALTLAQLEYGIRSTASASALPWVPSFSRRRITICDSEIPTLAAYSGSLCYNLRAMFLIYAEWPPKDFPVKRAVVFFTKQEVSSEFPSAWNATSVVPSLARPTLQTS